MQSTNELVWNKVTRSQLCQMGRIISAHQIQKLAKEDNPVFLAILRQTNDAPQKRGKKMNKRSLHRVENFVVAHGMTEGEKWKISRETGPRKDIILVAERERQVLNSVSVSHKENLEKLIKEYSGVFAEKLPKGVPPLREVRHHIEIESGSKPPDQPSYWLGPAE